MLLAILLRELSYHDPPVIDADGNERFVVERVPSQRVHNKKKLFCVKLVEGL